MTEDAELILVLTKPLFYCLCALRRKETSSTKLLVWNLSWLSLASLLLHSWCVFRKKDVMVWHGE